VKTKINLFLLMLVKVTQQGSVNIYGYNPWTLHKLSDRPKLTYIFIIAIICDHGIQKHNKIKMNTMLKNYS